MPASSRLPAVTLRPFPLAEARALASGTGLHQEHWAAGFPSTGTISGVALILAAYEALGVALEVEPAWWICQILAGGSVVGEVGFHGPPDPDGCVELGYEVVPGWRRRGVATRACRLLLERGWQLGARAVRAETELDNVGSRRVLEANGFRLEDDDPGPRRYRIDRP